VSDQPREQSRSGCGAALAWFLAVGLIRAVGRELGWSDGAQVVERCMNRLKQWRGIATRFDKRAANYRAAVVIVSLVLWPG
jgi:hypothetical protein